MIPLIHVLKFSLKASKKNGLVNDEHGNLSKVKINARKLQHAKKNQGKYEAY